MSIILVIALLVFGPRKLPELGGSLGRTLTEFKRASNELQRTLDEEVRAEERKHYAAAQVELDGANRVAHDAAEPAVSTGKRAEDSVDSTDGGDSASKP